MITNKIEIDHSSYQCERRVDCHESVEMAIEEVTGIEMITDLPSIFTLQAKKDVIGPTSYKISKHHKPEKFVSVADFRKMATKIAELQKQLEVVTAKLETLQQNTTVEINNNNNLLELQQAKLVELQQQLLECQRLQDILVSYGNNREGVSAFLYAIKVGDKGAVELLIKHGVDVKSDPSFIVCAASENQPEIVRLLIKNGADVNARQSKPVELSHYAAIHYAASKGNVEVIKCLIENGADINANLIIDKDNPHRTKTALHIAAELGYFEAVVALVNGGADVNNGRMPRQNESWSIYNKEGGPLDAAVYKLKCADNPRNLDLIKFLVEHGAERKFPVYGMYSAMNGQGGVFSVRIIPCEIIESYLVNKNK